MDNIIHDPPNNTCIRKPYLSHSNKNPNSNSNVVTPGYFTASQLARIYGFPPPNTSISTVVGVMSFGGGLYGTIDKNGVLTGGDLQKIWAYENISQAQMPLVIVKRFDGLTNAQGLSDLTSTIENTLDVSAIGSCCPSNNLTILLFIFSGYSTFYNAFKTVISGTIISNKSYVPSIISVSWGCSETANELTDSIATTKLLEAATKNGLNVCVASGDYGSTNGNIMLTVDFPSSCPYVTAVGGTTLVCKNGIYDSTTSETVWNDGVVNNVFQSTGGGISTIFSKPSYQSNINSSYRNIPDIALDADPDTGVLLFINGSNRYIIGGTSLSAPLFAGYLATINVKTFVNPLLYTANSNCFNDILFGCNYDTSSSIANKSYKAQFGYDNCSGLGSIIGGALSRVLSPSSVPISEPIKATNISISPSAASLNLNTTRTIQFTYTISPTTTSNKQVSWMSSNTRVATINSTGLLTGLTPGNVTIRVTTTGGTKILATSNIIVSAPKILTKSINLLPSTSNLNLSTHKTLTLIPIILPKNSTYKIIKWVSGNKSICNVNSSGLVTAVGVGTTYIYAYTMDGSNKYTIKRINVFKQNNSISKMTYAFRGLTVQQQSNSLRKNSYKLGMFLSKM
jgi:subtilase family serine protease